VADKFEENLHADLGRWPVTHLDWPLLPGFPVIWAKPNEWQPPGDQERVDHERAAHSGSVPPVLPPDLPHELPHLITPLFSHHNIRS
jgi:hypothetical protein